MIGRIYIIRNTVNNKVYIGQTTKSLEKRLSEHRVFAKENASSKFYKAMYDLGKNNFYIELLVELDVTGSQLTLLEQYFILKYNSIETGYNTVIPVGEHFRDIEYLAERTEEMLNDYKSGVSYNDMCSKYKISKNQISKICSQFNLDRQAIFEVTNKKKPVVAYNVNSFEPEIYFDSIMDAYKYLYKLNSSITARGAYYYIRQSTAIGSIAYGYRWQLLEDLEFKGKIFRTKFDKEAYINGAQCKLVNNKYYICDNALDNVKGFNNKLNTCIDCGKIIGRKAIRCKNCYSIWSNKKDNKYTCISCGKNNANNPNGLCNSCIQVMNKGKSPKPSREELIQLINSGISNKEIAKRYDRSPSTVSFWIKSYELNR